MSGNFSSVSVWWKTGTCYADRADQVTLCDKRSWMLYVCESVQEPSACTSSGKDMGIKSMA